MKLNGAGGETGMGDGEWQRGRRAEAGEGAGGRAGM